ncbi:conserved protein of unknown function [Xenorhabdus nematophila AN6/1]|nr:conserved protein of unknown function [Xenorhabdus nematophila AN6/1]
MPFKHPAHVSMLSGIRKSAYWHSSVHYTWCHYYGALYIALRYFLHWYLASVLKVHPISTLRERFWPPLLVQKSIKEKHAADAPKPDTNS